MRSAKVVPLSLQDILTQIQEKNYATLPMAIPHFHIETAMADFFAFLALPEEVKRRFRHKLDIKNHGSEAGWARKSTGHGDKDEKEFFHFTPYTREVFRDLPERNDPEVQRFFNSAEQIHRQMTEIVSALLDTFETKYPGIKRKFIPGDRRPFFYLRFLRYVSVPNGEFLAKGHYDRGTMTLAIAESAPGLRIGLNAKSLQPVDRSEGDIVFMPALRLRDITSAEDFPPAWHDVVQSSDRQLSDETARWALVFFADTVDQNHTPWAEAHTPMG